MKPIAFALILTLIAVPAFANDGPVPANEGYCVGIDPAACAYSYAQNNGRWFYETVFLGDARQSREDGRPGAKALPAPAYRPRPPKPASVKPRKPYNTGTARPFRYAAIAYAARGREDRSWRPERRASGRVRPTPATRFKHFADELN
jgi:hypothetical protein